MYRETENYLADTNMNTLLEGGIATEIHFDAEKNCSSAEDSFMRSQRDHHDIIFGSSECFAMLVEPDGCLECRKYVRCILNLEVETIEIGKRRQAVRDMQRVAKRLNTVTV